MISSVSRFLSPLWTFIAGMAMLVFSTLFYPDIIRQANQASAQLAAEGVQTSHYWGLPWAMSSPRLILFVSGLLLVVFSTLWWWLKRKWGKQ